MGKVGLGIVLLLVLAAGAAGVAMMTLDLPAPRQPVEKVIPNDRVLD